VGNHFLTPSVGDGLLLAAGADNVVAFASPAPGAQATAASPAPQPSSAPPAAPAAPAQPSWRYIAAGAFGALVVIIGLGWLLARRRRGAS